MISAKLFLAGGLALLAMPAWANDQADFIAKLHAINLAEIQVGSLASTKSKTPEVKSYGQMLEEDHRQADAQLILFAKNHSVDPNPGKPSAAVAELKQQLADIGSDLQMTPPDQFDQVFAHKMVSAHEDAIKLANEAKTKLGSNRDYVTLANGLLPTLEHHREEAAKIDRSLAH
jgi:putative membrane protein